VVILWPFQLVKRPRSNTLEPTKNYFYDLRVLYEEYKREVDFGEFQEIFQNGWTTETKARYYWLTHFPNQPPRSLEEIKLLCITLDNAEFLEDTKATVDMAKKTLTLEEGLTIKFSTKQIAQTNKTHDYSRKKAELSKQKAQTR